MKSKTQTTRNAQTGEQRKEKQGDEEKKVDLQNEEKQADDEDTDNKCLFFFLLPLHVFVFRHQYPHNLSEGRRGCEGTGGKKRVKNWRERKETDGE